MTSAQPVGVLPGGGFPIAQPVLSRGSADRSEDLRDRARIEAAWPTARVLVIDRGGRTSIEVDTNSARLLVRPAADFGPLPPADAVLLGTVLVTDTETSAAGTAAAAGAAEPSYVDYWAIPGDVEGGEALWAFGGERSGLRDVGALLSDTDAGLLTAGVAVMNWHRDGAFCPKCGLPSLPELAGWSRICANGHQEFPRTDPAVIVLVHDGAGRMVLARQPSWPAGRFSVLAGFVEAGEPLEGTVSREIFEEVGLTVTDIVYLGSQPWPFPRSLMLGFAARAEAGAVFKPRDGEIEAPMWVDRSAIRRALAADGAADGFELPGSLSIARRMIEGWAALD